MAEATSEEEDVNFAASSDCGKSHISIVKLASAGSLLTSWDTFPADERALMSLSQTNNETSSFKASVDPNDTPVPEQLLNPFIVILPIIS
jgi:hypothetical protein